MFKGVKVLRTIAKKASTYMFLARGTVVGADSTLELNSEAQAPLNHSANLPPIVNPGKQDGAKVGAVEWGMSGANAQPPNQSSGYAASPPSDADVSRLSLDQAVTKGAIKVLADVPGSKKIRVMVCGTHPQQYNGYSKVIYEMGKRMSEKEDIALTIYGFQNFQQTRTHRDPLPANVTVHDALLTEEPRRGGFGEKEVANYLKSHPQDIVIIYNDMAVTSLLTNDIVKNIPEEERRRFVLVSYIDQVYLNQKKRYIHTLNEHFQHIIAFTDYWAKVLREQGIKKDIPIDVFPHGFDPQRFYPVPKKLARIFFQIPQDAFVILNLNRNQPRKRWDHCIMAYAEVVKKHQHLIKAHPDKKPKPIKFLIGTALNACWELPELFVRELRKRGLPDELVNEYMIAVAKPQQLSDRDVNVLYNAADIGINTCDGEGYGLCNFEMAAVGNPQVVPRLGGFREFFHEQSALFVEPKWSYVVSNERDAIGGEAECSDPNDFAAAIWKYYQTPNLVRKHGKRAREDILSNYHWDHVVNHFHRVLKKIYHLHIENKEKTEQNVEK